MEELLADKKWRRKNSLWVLLSVLPLLGGLAFFHIGYKARRRNWTLLGVAFTAVWAAYPVIRFFCAAFMDSSGYWRFCNGTELYPLAVVPLSLAGLIGALLLRKNYLKLLAKREAAEPEEHPLLADGAWRRKNSLWMLWSFLPGFGAVSLFHLGHRMKKWRLTLAGILLAVFNSSMAASYLFRLGEGGRRLWNFVTGSVHFSVNLRTLYLYPPTFFLLLFWVGIYFSAVMRREYLRDIAPGYEETRGRYACLNSWKWRTLQSWWMLLCLIPYCAGAALLAAGLRGKKRSWTIGGGAVSLFYIVEAVVLRVCQSAALKGSDTVVNAALLYIAFVAVRRLMAICVFAACTVIREDYLVARAARLGGYDSQIDQELAQQEQFHRRIQGEEPVPAEKPVPEKKLEKKPVKPVEKAPEKPAEAPEGALDLNACSEEELRTLPGISLVEAKKAVEYRASHGGFASVDEFIDVLGIKPHFAVQIFERAAVKAAAPAPRAAEEKTVRRRIDL